MRVQAVESENVLDVSGEEIPSLELADQIAVCRQVPVMEPSSMSVDTSSTTMSMSMPQSQHEAEDSGTEQGDIVQNAQFFQDVATEYQLAYQSLDEKYTHQAIMVGKDGVTNPKESCRYCKDIAHLLENCLQLEARDQFHANQEKLKEGLN